MILAIFRVVHEFDNPLVHGLLGVSAILVFLAFLNNLGNIIVNDLSWWSTQFLGDLLLVNVENH